MRENWELHDIVTMVSPLICAVIVFWGYVTIGEFQETFLERGAIVQIVGAKTTD